MRAGNLDRSDFYVYVHSRANTGEPFYIGKGHGRRFGKESQRSEYWKRIAAKAGGVLTNFLADGIDEELAMLIEIEAIDKYRRLGVKLANLTDGGDGTSGYKFSQEYCKKMGDRFRGVVKSEETRRKLSLANKGRAVSEETRLRLTRQSYALREISRRPKSEEHKRKIAITNTGKRHSEESKRKMSAQRMGNKINLGRKASAETKAKLSAIQKGKINGPASAETKAKISAALKGRTLSEQHKANVSAALKGRIVSVETRQKLSIANGGKKRRPMSEITKAKLSEIWRLKRCARVL